jgi:hypothetical protein
MSESKGQVIVNKDRVCIIHPFKFSEATPALTAVLLRGNGKQGKTLHEDTEALADRQCEAVASVLEDWSLFALQLIEAAHRGDHATFRNISDALRKVKDTKRKPEIQGLIQAARKEGDTPTVSQVHDEMKEMGSEATYQSKKHIKRNLANQGFDLKSEKVGRPKTEG